jgi:RNA methyltransferase, TrmH family
MITITSAQNPVIKDVKSLKSRKYREEKGLFFAEGSRIVEEAVKENNDVIYTIISEDYISENESSFLLDKLEKSTSRNYVVPSGLFKELSDTETPQGILAVIALKKYSFNDKAINNGLFLILDMIRDPGNMGTIIRTADAAGLTGVVITGGCVDAYNPKVVRSTMGSIFHIPLYYFDTGIDAIRFLKAKGIKIYASHLKGACSIYEADLTCPAAIIIGSEADGISEDTALQADMLVRIPMNGKAESLNASVAAGIIMYEAVRQRQK